MNKKNPLKKVAKYTFIIFMINFLIQKVFQFKFISFVLIFFMIIYIESLFFDISRFNSYQEAFFIGFPTLIIFYIVNLYYLLLRSKYDNEYSEEDDEDEDD